LPIGDAIGFDDTFSIAVLPSLSEAGTITSAQRINTPIEDGAEFHIASRKSPLPVIRILTENRCRRPDRLFCIKRFVGNCLGKEFGYAEEAVQRGADRNRASSD
jgi:hypothetical protein